jgi:hypothetical protein
MSGWLGVLAKAKPLRGFKAIAYLKILGTGHFAILEYLARESAIPAKKVKRRLAPYLHQGHHWLRKIRIEKG